jgi:8-oxo-dGTP pyrophosphatase MutT (NUDIX family)
MTDHDDDVQRGVAVLLLTADDRLVLMLRDDSPAISSPNQWALFGGFAKAGEDLHSAAERELGEELTTADGAPARVAEMTALSSGPSNVAQRTEHYFCARLLDPLDGLVLREGQRFAAVDRAGYDRLGVVATHHAGAIERHWRRARPA